MDKITRYRRIMRRLVNEYAGYRPSHGQIEPIAVCDPKNDNYLLLHVGWDNIRRTHATILHLRLKNGRILIEEDGLEHGIGQELIEAGVAPQDIIYSAEKEDLAVFKKAS
jgi:hypothetical protein